MRTDYQNGVTVTYPEDVVWLQDSNVINLECNGHTVGAAITVRHPGGMETRTITHMGEMPSLLFVLDGALEALHDDNIGQYTCQADIYRDGTLSHTISFNFQLLDGKSFTNRSHAVSRTLYLYDMSDLRKVQFYSPSPGYLTVGNWSFELSRGLNQFDLSYAVTHDGVWTVCLTDGLTNSSAWVTGDVCDTPWSSNLYWAFQPGGQSGDSEKGGDVWKEVDIFPFCHRLVVDTACSRDNVCELRYRDCDGCERHLAGRITTEANKAETVQYTRTERYNCFRNIPRRKITGTARTIKAAFNDIATDAYAQDIRYSELVEMRMWDGEWWPVAVQTDSVAVKGDQDTQDIELEITISEE